MNGIELINVSEIKIPPRLRVANQDKVKELSESIGQYGLINPIGIDQNYNLICGLHRLEACKLLKREQVECNMIPIDYTETLAQMYEIDENLVRNDLSAFERAEYLGKRYELFKILALNEGDIANSTIHKNKNEFTDKMSVSDKKQKVGRPKEGYTDFVNETAKKTNLSTRTVERDLRISKNISKEIKEAIKDTPVAKNKTLLNTIAGVKPEKQSEALQEALQDNGIDKFKKPPPEVIRIFNNLISEIKKKLNAIEFQIDDLDKINKLTIEFYNKINIIIKMYDNTLLQDNTFENNNNNTESQVVNENILNGDLINAKEIWNKLSRFGDNSIIHIQFNNSMADDIIYYDAIMRTISKSKYGREIGLEGTNHSVINNKIYIGDNRVLLSRENAETVLIQDIHMKA